MNGKRHRLDTNQSAKEAVVHFYFDTSSSSHLRILRRRSPAVPFYGGDTPPPPLSSIEEPYVPLLPPSSTSTSPHLTTTTTIPIDRSFSLVRLIAFWMIAINSATPTTGATSNTNSNYNASASGGGGQQRSGDQRYFSSCPFDKLDGCFRRVFSTMGDPQGAMVGCEDYERLSACFRYVNCSEKETSEVGARVFVSIRGGVRLPKEFFNALMTRWRLRCATICSDYEPEECRRSMALKEQDHDEALMMEMQSLKMQMSLSPAAGSSSSSSQLKELCVNFKRAMARWHQFRSDKCSVGDSGCYCRREERRLRPLSCNVNCEKLQQYIISKSSSTSSPSFGLRQEPLGIPLCLYLVVFRAVFSFLGLG